MTEPPQGGSALLHTPSRLSRRTLVGLACLSPFASLAHAAERVAVAELWAEASEFSARAKELAGKPVEMRGYMAPPLKPEVDFFVLTSLPMAVCPFCDSAAAWPEDIVLVFLNRPVRAIAYDRLLIVSG